MVIYCHYKLNLILIGILIFERYANSIYAFPYLVFEKGKKCMKVDLPSDANINVHWQIIGYDGNERSDLQQIHTDMKKYAHEKKNEKSDHQNIENLIMPTILEIEPLNLFPEFEGARKILDKTHGALRYNSEYEGIINVCISTMSRNPVIMSLRISESSISSLEENIPKLNVDKVGKAQKMAKHHLNDMDRAINQMIRESNLLLTNADAVKNVEAKFHQKSVDINAASKWWPILHLVVLLVTGFTQANHVINFFKMRYVI